MLHYVFTLSPLTAVGGTAIIAAVLLVVISARRRYRDALAAGLIDHRR